MISKADSLTYRAAQRVREGESLEETLLEIREIRLKQNIPLILGLEKKRG